MSCNDHPRRRGMTLVELLVVVGIMTLLMAIAIPMVRPAMETREIREGARAVSAYFASARMRAAKLKRPCGVILERNPARREACVTLRQIEIPPPYSGELENTTVRVAWDGWLDWDGVAGTARVVDREGTGPGEDGAEGYTDLAYVQHLRKTRPPLITIYLEPYQGSGHSCRAIFRPGDRIRLGTSGYWARILPATPVIIDPSDSAPINTTVYPSTSPWAGYVRFETGPTLGTGSNSYPMRAIVEVSDATDLPWPDDDRDDDDDGDTLPDWTQFSGLQLDGTPQPGITAPPPWPFEIELQPAAHQTTAGFSSGVEPLQLLGNAVIDLSGSGTDSVPTGLGPASATDESPIIFVFSPTGTIEAIYHHGLRERVLDPFYLMLGTRQRMVDDDPDFDSSRTDMDINMPQKVSPDDGLPNWQDPDNYWLVLNPQTGAVNLSPGAFFDEAAVSGFDYYGNLAHRVAAFAIVRELARKAQVMGGR